MKRSLRNQTLIGHRLNRHCLLEQAVEQLSPVSRQSPVEAGREFIQVIVEVLPGDPPLVNAKQPPFQQGGNREIGTATILLVTADNKSLQRTADSRR